MAVDPQRRVTANTSGVPVFSSPTPKTAAYVSKASGDVLGTTTGVTKPGPVPGQTFIELLYVATVPFVGQVPVKGYVDEKEAITIGSASVGTVPGKTDTDTQGTGTGGKVIVGTGGRQEVELPDGRTLQIELPPSSPGAASPGWLVWAVAGLGLLMVGTLVLVVRQRSAPTPTKSPKK